MTEALTNSDERRRRTGLSRPPAARVAAGAALALALAGVPSVNAAVRSARAIPDVTILFPSAVNIVHGTRTPTYSRAVVLEADGITKGGRCTTNGCFGGSGTRSASGVVSWRFVFNNQASRSRFKSATITYGPPPKSFGTVIGYRSIFVEDIQIPTAPRMTLSQAVALLKRAGHRGVFFNVTLRNPVGPKKSNPLYIFGFANQAFVAVDTVTKKVKPFG